MSTSFRISIALLLFISALAPAQQNQPLPKDRGLSATADSLTRANGRITLDVVVTNKSGRPVIGLERQDFTVLDNGERGKIHSFQAFNSTTAKPATPVEVILVINLSTMSGQQADAAKYEVEKFLRANYRTPRTARINLSYFRRRGFIHARAPLRTGTLWLTKSHGERSSRGVGATQCFMQVKTDPRAGVMVTSFGRTKITLLDAANLNSMQYLGSIVLELRRKPGRKLLFWLGTGWRGSCNQCFDWITEFSTRLREARITLWNVCQTWIAPWMESREPAACGDRRLSMPTTNP